MILSVKAMSSLTVAMLSVVPLGPELPGTKS